LLDDEVLRELHHILDEKWCLILLEERELVETCLLSWQNVIDSVMIRPFYSLTCVPEIQWHGDMCPGP